MSPTLLLYQLRAAFTFDFSLVFAFVLCPRLFNDLQVLSTSGESGNYQTLYLKLNVETRLNVAIRTSIVKKYCKQVTKNRRKKELNIGEIGLSFLANSAGASILLSSHFYFWPGIYRMRIVE